MVATITAAKSIRKMVRGDIEDLRLRTEPNPFRSFASLSAPALGYACN